MVLYQLIPDKKYSVKAKELARKKVSKMDDDYFITGEGGRAFGVKYGVDLTYNIELSLLFVLKSGKAELTIGKEKEKYWSAYPALKAYPIVLTVTPDSTTFEQTIEYEFKLN